MHVCKPTRSVCEYGLSTAVGPLNVGVLASGGGDDGGWLAVRDAGDTGKVVSHPFAPRGERVGLAVASRVLPSEPLAAWPNQQLLLKRASNLGA